MPVAAESQMKSRTTTTITTTATAIARASRKVDFQELLYKRAWGESERNWEALGIIEIYYK